MYWVKTTDARKFHTFVLSTYSEQFLGVQAAFRETTRNEVVSIERIQNEEMYGLYNCKRKIMKKKYGSNFPSKEKMLFHGTSRENLEKINADGLNRAYAGTHGKIGGGSCLLTYMK